MNFVCIVFELGDKMLTLSSMENLIVQCNHNLDYIITIFMLVVKTRQSNDSIDLYPVLALM